VAFFSDRPHTFCRSLYTSGKCSIAAFLIEGYGADSASADEPGQEPRTQLRSRMVKQTARMMPPAGVRSDPSKDSNPISTARKLVDIRDKIVSSVFEPTGRTPARAQTVCLRTSHTQ